MPAETQPGDAALPGAGVPDAFGRLWTPHRLAYIQGGGKPTGPGDHEDCPFCIAPTLTDEEGLIVARGALVYAVMNLYPYNSGHVLICPYRHLADYTELTAAETAEFSDYTKRTIAALRAVSGPHGFNLGMNLGTVAGACIAAHLHQHVVPRWGGDTNYFMPVIGRTGAAPARGGRPQADRGRLAELAAGKRASQSASAPDRPPTPDVTAPRAG